MFHLKFVFNKVLIGFVGRLYSDFNRVLMGQLARLRVMLGFQGRGDGRGRRAAEHRPSTHRNHTVRALIQKPLT